MISLCLSENAANLTTFLKLADFGKDSEMFSLSSIYFIYDAVNLSVEGFYGQANIKTIFDLFVDQIRPAPFCISWSIYQNVKNKFLKIQNELYISLTNNCFSKKLNSIVNNKIYCIYLIWVSLPYDFDFLVRYLLISTIFGKS